MKWMLLPAGIFTADYIMKKRAESWNEEEAPEKMLGGHIILQKLHNRGAALSFMEKTPKLLTGVTTVVTAGMTAFYAYLIKKPKQLFLKTGVGMILGGAWSNVWDHITRKYVVDYFSFHTKCRKLERVVFNLADMFIFLGGFLVIFWNMLRKS